MQVNTSECIFSVYQCVALPASALYEKCRELAIDIFKGLKHCLTQAVKRLKAYLWKAPETVKLPERVKVSENVPAPSSAIRIDKISRNVPLLARESSRTLSLIHSAPIRTSLSFGQGCELTLDVFKRLLSELSAQDLRALLLVNKEFLALLKDPDVLNQLIFNSKDVNHFKLASVLGPFLTEICLEDSWTDEGFIEFIRKCPNLTSIQFPFTGGLGAMTHHSISALIQACPRLNRIALYFWNDTDAYVSIQELAKMGSNLKTLTLKWTTHIGSRPIDRERTDNVMRSLVQNCPNLTDVNLLLPNMTDKTVQALAENCRKLTNVSLSSSGLTTEGLKALIQSCTDLIELNLSNYTDEVLEAIGAHLPNLSKIHMRDSSITDAGVQALVKSCKHLTSLSINRCKNITDEAVKAVAENCPDLTYFCINCEKVTGNGIEAILRSCRKLSKLELGEGDVTSQMIQAIADNGQNLTTLSLHHEKLTEELVQKLAQTYRQIEDLNLKMCRNIEFEIWREWA